VHSCLIVQHLEPEAPYAIGDALADAGVVTDVRRVYDGEPLPSNLSEVDGLVVMGGPMSALSDEGFPTRRAEISLFDDAISRGLPTLGVCLGAQLLALAAGGVVHAGPTGPEIGWGPVSFTDQAGEDPLLAGLPPTLTVLHWHGDTFELPPGAVHLAANSRYRNQAFRIGARAWGLQFHLEVDHGAVVAFLGAFGADAAAAGTTPRSIEAETAEVLEVLTPHRTEVLSRFAGLVAAPDRHRLADRSASVLPPR
jgi:GMP synthase-like glutamine amidotransferase